MEYQMVETGDIAIWRENDGFVTLNCNLLRLQNITHHLRVIESD